MKVIIENFQTISHAELNFVVGINHICGLNGSGKSSIIEAIRCAILNPSGTSDVISWWAKEARVTLEDDNNSITWVRTKSSSCYIDNKTGTPINNASKLNIRDISSLPCCLLPDGSLLNVPNRWSKLFPFGESGTTMFKIFEDLFEINKSTNVINSFKSKDSDYKKAIMTSKDKLSEYDFKLQNIKTCLQDIDIDHIDNLATDLLELEKQNNLLQIGIDNLNKLTYLDITIPDMIVSNIDEDMIVLDQLRSIISSYDNNCKYIQLPINLNEVNFDSDLDDDIAYLNRIKNDLDHFKTCGVVINDYDDQLKQLNDQLANLEADLKEFKVCPLCGKEL